MMDAKNPVLLMAWEVAGSTLLGSGNCFSVNVDHNTHWKEYRIVNFYLETLEELLEAGLTWPVGVVALEGNRAVLHDPRIEDAEYPQEWCSVCCPEHLLPLPQQLKHRRHELQGIRRDLGDGAVSLGGPYQVEIIRRLPKEEV